MEFEFRVLVEHYPTLARGLLGTLEAIALSLFIGILLGLIFCIGSLSDSRPVYRLSRAYIDFFRVTPEITLIFWVYFCLPPILDVTLSALASGVLALSLVTGAFLAEIFRAGILAIPRGQVEAALALGIPAFHRWRRIIIPPAVRRMMPAFVNYFTELLKHSTLLSGHRGCRIDVPSLCRRIGDLSIPRSSERHCDRLFHRDLSPQSLRSKIGARPVAAHRSVTRRHVHPASTRFQ